MPVRRLSAPVIAAGLAASLLSGCAFFQGDDEPVASKPTVPAAPVPMAQQPATPAPDTIMPGAQGQAAGRGPVYDLPLDGHITPPVDPPDAQRLVAQADAQMEDKDGKGASSQAMAQALALFDQAMARGSLKAREALAVYYYYGRGTGRDPQKAAEVVKPAAQAGLPMAALIYGQLYNNGSIPGGGAGEAQYWYNVARRAGCAPCMSSHQEFLNSIEAKLNLPPSKGQGDLASDPIVLTGIADDAAGTKREYAVLGILYPGWKQVEQHRVVENGRQLDQFTLENTQKRRVRVYFDATDWGKPAAKGGPGGGPGAK
ncbi:hypothetical protein [Nitrospirillum sp. BR 11828]|uniref:tetratricopeptide repeat protein n=1 Tax=Nitrospirillum sp. BR 11828 TaxID=3104325 RepID=UPI002ACAFA36|nr:hypothetical protein [Nitrospirillum sp. BR 11828]MDZ5649268.1 hypothetical protein [Nitrospirillum sp. BR 11828]